MDINVNDILQSIFINDVKDGWKASEKIPLIAKEIANIQQDLKKFLEESDYDISSVLEETRSLCNESSILIQEMETCQVEIHNETMTEIARSIENHDKLLKNQEIVQFKLDLVSDILRCHGYLNSYYKAKENGGLYRSVDAIHDLMQTLENPIEGFNQLAIYETFKLAADTVWENSMKENTNMWEQMVSWEKDITSQETTVTIHIKLKNTTQEILDLLYAMCLCKQLQPNISAFANFILTDVVDPIIIKDCTIYAEVHVLNKINITFNHSNKTKPSYRTVIINLRTFFNYLNMKLNISLMNGQHVMQMIGDEIKIAFSQKLVKNCFMDTVPNTISELDYYRNVVDEIKMFQQYLVSINFFPANTKLLTEFIDNLDLLFADRSSQYYLERAREIMLKDLSLSMSIGVEMIPESNSDYPPVDPELDQALQIFRETIPQSLFYFPRCMISKSTQELLDLINNMMEQAGQSIDEVSKKLYITVRLIFELYDAVVPYHHENFLLTLPQYVVLFHNNCMYLAHNLLTLGDKWRNSLSDRKIDYPIGFQDLVIKLRELGCKHLAIQLQQQRKQILDNIRTSDLNCIVGKDVLSENAEQAIRQCLRQLQLVKNVWIGVLPMNIFTRLMATLVNMFVDEIIHRVCTVEDISAEMATQLTEIYTIVVTKAPNLFESSGNIESYVKSWIKLQELILVLGGSLKDIEKRWNEGTGPLALHFRTEELRNLIKALFQNTQLRANLLSKIK